MKTTVDFLNDVKVKYDLPSDYALAKKLGMTRQRISRYRAGLDHLGDDAAVTVADALEVQPGYVLACIAAERTKSETARKAWERAAQVLGGIAAGVVILTNPVLGLDAETASLLTLAAESSALCILC